MNLFITLIALGILQPTPAFAESLHQPAVIEYSTSTAELIIDAYAVKWGVSGDDMWAVTECENASLDPMKQSEVPDATGPGGHENSWGNSQINLHYHPEVTKAQAQNPYFAADFMGRLFSKGRQYEWSCWSRVRKASYRILAAV